MKNLSAITNNEDITTKKYVDDADSLKVDKTSVVQTLSTGTKIGEVNGTEFFAPSGGGGGTTDYDDLTDKPQINSTTLSGDKSSADLGLQDELTSSVDIETGSITASDDIWSDGNIEADGSINCNGDMSPAGNILAGGDIEDGAENVLSNKVDASSLAAVATSGDYDDLINVPSIPTVPSVLTFYGTNSQNASATNRTVDVNDTNFTLTQGVIVSVKFTNSVPSAAYLNVNSTGLKAIYYKNTTIVLGDILADDLVTFQYDGTYWRIISIARVPNKTSELTNDSGFTGNPTVKIGTGSEVATGGFYIRRGVSIKDNISVAANSYEDHTTAVSSTGYTLIGVIGFYVANASSSGSGGMNAIVNQCYVSAADSITYRISNKSSSAIKVRIYMDLLYFKN